MVILGWERTGMGRMNRKVECGQRKQWSGVAKVRVGVAVGAEKEANGKPWIEVSIWEM